MEVIDASTGEIIASEQEYGLIFQADGFKFTPTGLVVSGDPAFELWQVVGQKLLHIEAAVKWWIGDWLNYGERRWGETFAQAVEETPYSEGTLANIKWIAGSVPISRRSETLSFSHHAEVAPLPAPEQERWLAEAEAEGLTTRQLRRAIRRPKLAADCDPGPMLGQVDHATLTVTLWPRSQAEIAEVMDRLEGLVKWK